MEKKNFIALLDNLTLSEKIRAEELSLNDLYKLYPEKIIYFESYEKRKNHNRIFFSDDEYPINLYQIENPPYFIDYIGCFPKKNTITVINDKISKKTLDREAYIFALETNLNGYNLITERKTGASKEVIKSSLSSTFPIFTISHLGIFKIEELIDRFSRFQLLCGGGIITSSNPFSCANNLENFLKKDKLLSSLSNNFITFSLNKNSYSYHLITDVADRFPNVFCHKEALVSSGVKDLVLSGLDVVSGASEMLEKMNKEVKGYLYSNINGEYKSPFGCFSFLSFKDFV